MLDEGRGQGLRSNLQERQLCDQYSSLVLKILSRLVTNSRISQRTEYLEEVAVAKTGELRH